MLNQQELKESREEQVDQLVNLFYALLLLAIVISLFGIANTLALSIHERTRASWGCCGRSGCRGARCGR